MNAEKVHPFTTTLGPGPYRFLGLIQIKVSETRGTAVVGDVGLNPERGVGTCAHCGHAIMDCYVIETGDRRRFAVGSDCVMKTYMDWNGKVPTDFERKKRALASKKRAERKLAKRLADVEFVQKAVDDRWAYFMRLPHSNEKMTEQGYKFLDYLNYCLKIKSCESAVKRIKELEKDETS